MMRGTFQAKDAAERIALPFDFSRDLGAASISTATLAIALDAGDEGAAPATLSPNGDAVVSGGVVYAPVKDGVAMCDYVVTCTAALNDGRVLVLAGLLPVRVA